MKMKKKSLAVLCLVLVLTMLAGCTSKAPEQAPAASENQEEWKFERKIEMVIPFGPGSGTDTTIRAMAPLLEKELGVPITINNVAGASGVFLP